MSRTAAAVLGQIVLALGLAFFIFPGCSTQGNHIVQVDVPSGTVAGVATERGILLLQQITIKKGDVYPFRHTYGNGVVKDEALVVEINEYLALLRPISSQLNSVRFLQYPLEPDDDFFVGILDTENDTIYLNAQWMEKGARGDFILCDELALFPNASPQGYGGIGVYVERSGYYWLAGIMIPAVAEMSGTSKEVYPFIGMEQIWSFIPESTNLFSQEKKPFRPDFIYGVNRDGSGE